MASLLTPEGILVYPYLFKAKLSKDAKPDDKPKFSCRVLFTKEQTETPEYKAMVAACLASARDKWGSDADTMIQDGSIRFPFRKDVSGKGYPPEIVVFINATAGEDQPPEVVARDGKTRIKSPADLYSGVRGRVSVGCFAYIRSGNKGVSFGLRNAQKLGDGPRLDNRKSASEEFGASPAGPEEPAGDLSSMIG